jgi:prepilin-type N-terminal cleavage/methylation domain-containing protein
MKEAGSMRGASRSAFTLLELMIVIAIIAILAGILMPVTQNIITRARDQQCANNLRQIGVAANAAANDNDNTYPIIEIDGNNQPVANTLNVPAKNLVDALSPYGVTATTFQCPADLRGPNNYASQNPHSSYMWSPYSEDTSSNVPTIYRRRGQTTILPSRLQLASDWTPVHMAYDSNVGAGMMIYVLYGDGHVKTTRRTPPKPSS